ncbi:hypothetical protein [Novosphingobium sp. KCTC 2891]|uniref:hypothetical protein n=1 Tax=Novosphingobium sp. KCTC 2891 TaxID=2989730 RepID=UPI002222FB35|nr:hypothetical protein [Novosphingobium sp. KCTC 2891]
MSLESIARAGFWLAAAFAVVMAVMPTPPRVPLDRYGDKAEHMIAFATLALLAGFAFPRMPRLRIAERLSFLGALIEVVQSIPALHRDCDIRDWVADTLAIVVTLAVVNLVRPAGRR